MRSTLKTLAVAIALALVAGVISCENAGGDGPIVLLPYELTFQSSPSTENDEDEDASEFKVVYVTSGKNWKTTINGSWIYIAETTDAILVTVADNLTGKDREGTITVSNSDDRKVVKVIQLKASKPITPIDPVD